MGLYDDDNRAITTGDVNDETYWYARAHAEALEMALETRQPEGAIRDFVKDVGSACDAALGTFPAHEDIKRWKARAESVQAKVDADAPWARWKPDWPWNTPFLQGWVELNWAKCAGAHGDWATVYEQARAAGNHLGDYGAKKHMRAWSPDLQKWVEDASADVAALWEEARKHR